MMLVNIMASWANVLIYFDLPGWFQHWDKVVENDDDPDDVKAFKRFILGDDEYRNKRLKILPCVVDAPRMVKMLSPPKKELTISCALLPVAWTKRPQEGKQSPMLEIELDVMSNKAMRAMASIIQRNLTGMTVDLAVTVEKPDGQEEDEPSACLGMWRFDKVDITTCPYIPARVTPVADDIRRASVMLNLSESQQIAIAQEA